jgi:glucuronosyltransferase
MNAHMCECILNDNELIKEFKTCDVMISDMCLFCASIIRDLLDIPRVTFYSGLVAPTIHSWNHGIPLPLSYIPHIATGFTTKMNFFQRVANVIHFSLLSTFLYHNVRTNGNLMKVKYNILPERDYMESESDSDLVLVQTDFAINYARPLPPGN